ncbi:hypothetical protein TH0144_14380 [Helicobacter pylori]
MKNIYLTPHKKPMLFFMLPKSPLLRKKEKKGIKDGLIDESEKESLKILNEEMKNILGGHYKGHQIVSAQAAFYGLSSALIPESGFYKNKQKFLEVFKEE